MLFSESLTYWGRLDKFGLANDERIFIASKYGEQLIVLNLLFKYQYHLDFNLTKVQNGIPNLYRHL
jgi:hypothetical protein